MCMLMVGTGKTIAALLYAEVEPTPIVKPNYFAGLFVPGPSKNQQYTDSYPLLDSILERNSDGLGVMWYAKDGVPWAAKTVDVSETCSGEAGVEWLKKYMPEDDTPVAVHARFGTHGTKNRDNCHPFDVDGGWFMHNGVLDISTVEDPTMSDTRHFIQCYLKGRTQVLMEDEYGRDLIAEYIGANNKFAWASPDGEIYIVNEESGFWHEGVWFSNTYAVDMRLIDPTWRTYTHTGDPRAVQATTTTASYWADRAGHAAVAHYIEDDEGEYVGVGVGDEERQLELETADFGGFTLTELPYLEADMLQLVLDQESSIGYVVEALHDWWGQPVNDGANNLYSARLNEARDAVRDCDTAALATLRDEGRTYHIAQAICEALSWEVAEIGA